MDQTSIQTFARDIIVVVGKDGYYHAGCARLAIHPRGKAWEEVGEEIQKENFSREDRIAVKKEIMRLVSGWVRANKEEMGLPDEV